MKKFILLIILLFHLGLSAGIPIHNDYRGPTEQLIKRDSWSKIEKHLKKNKISTKYYKTFDKIAAKEDWGHIGYHGAKQEYRIYQDIIRMTIEEILGIEIKEDFHFLRIPGDSDLKLDSIEEFANYWGKVDNKTDTRAKQLLSMNYGLYSNHDNGGSCSLYLFVKGKSKHKVSYAKELEPFFKKLGISITNLKDLFAIGKRWLNQGSGVLLQISEDSHMTDKKKEAYNFADLECYPAERGGYRWKKHPISKEFETIMTNSYVSRKANIAPQLRLLINNHYTLNPFSQLSIKRWDLYDDHTRKSYEADLREAIKNLKYDSAKVKQYRETLLKTWL